MLKLLRKKKETADVPAKPQALVLPMNASNRSVEYITELVKKIRPERPRDFAQAELNFKAVLYQLNQDKSMLFSLRKALLSQFLNTNIVLALTESGVTSSRGFGQELMGKLKHKLLPSLQSQHDFLYVINKVFYRQRDHIWVEGIDKNLWIQFFEILGIQINLTESALIKQMYKALQILSYRITTLGLEKEITRQYADNSEDAMYPFYEQNRLVNEYLSAPPESRQPMLDNIEEALHNCNQSLQWIREQRKIGGTSLAQIFVTSRLQQQIERMFIILDVLDGDNSFNTDRFVGYFHTVVKNENRKNSLWEFVNQNTGFLAYQISEHSNRTGEKFITTTKKEFWRIFRSAAGGGIIISFTAIIKSLLGKLKMAPFWSGFLYSTNYSLGFILIQDTGSTLATKQPAYTANYVASSLDLKKYDGQPDLRNLAITVARVSRSQLASFAGNLVVVFPLTYLLAWLFVSVTGIHLAEGAAAQQLLSDQQPFHSLALLYACFTGMFLFLSGLVAGYVENHVVYGRIPERIRSTPSWKNLLGEKRLFKIAHYVERNLGALAGNIALGFFLGMASFFGKTFGIPFDIRHITISAANTAIGFLGLDHNISFKELWYTLFGVAVIGFLNFAVSFGLAFYVAVKSRGIRLRDYPEFLGILGRYFRKHPTDFFRARSNMRSPEELQ